MEDQAAHAIGGNELQGIEDMINLDTMSEDTILKNLQVRYLRDEIYVRSVLLKHSCLLLLGGGGSHQLKAIVLFSQHTCRPTLGPFWSASTPTRPW